MVPCRVLCVEFPVAIGWLVALPRHGRLDSRVFCELRRLGSLKPDVVKSGLDRLCLLGPGNFEGGLRLVLACPNRRKRGGDCVVADYPWLKLK